MTTLTDFLLARIAEDERDGWEVHIQGCPSVRDVPFPCECNYPARVLAECEAKRRIVDLMSENGGADSDFDSGWDAALVYALEYLAAAYADHADYDEEWRP